jgi:predicted Ser/Thr protein kinase
MTSTDSANLDTLRAFAKKTFREGRGSRPEVSLVDFQGAPAVLKDYTRCDPRFRRFLGPLSARREARALELLAGVTGVPRLLARPTPEAVVIEYVLGPSMREVDRTTVTPAFFERFYALLDSIHTRGVAHCDLRSQGNILLGPDGQPYIVDFVAHFKRGRRWNPLTRWLFGKFCEADRTAVARLKQAFAPALLSAAEQAALARDRKTPLERVARMIGKSFRNVSRWLLTRRTS